MIPCASNRIASSEKVSEEAKPVAAANGQGPSDGGLWVAQERLWQNERQAAEQAIALIERDQRLSALRAECDWLASQVDEERQRRQALEPEVDLARAGWAAAEKRANDLETGYNHAAERLQKAEEAIKEFARQLEVVKTERGDAVLELAHRHETLAELNLQLDQARAERAEMEKTVARARGELERTGRDLTAAGVAAERATAEASQMTAALSHLRMEFNLTVAERDKLRGIVNEDHDLAQYTEARFERDRIEIELRETQARLDGFSEKIEALSIERENLRRERTELQLKVAALRDAHDDTQLQQDNEVLRRMVERLNEELKLAMPEITKRKRREVPGGVVGGLARAVASRIFVPDAEM